MRQHVQRGFHAVGVSVVGVIQHRAAVFALFRLQTPFDVGKIRQTCANLRQRHTSRQRQSRRRTRIRHIVFARHRQMHALTLPRKTQIKIAG